MESQKDENDAVNDSYYSLQHQIQRRRQRNGRHKKISRRQHQHYSSQVKGSDNTITPNTGSSNILTGQNNVEVKIVSADKVDTNTALIIADGEKMVTEEFDEMGIDSSSITGQPNLSNTIRFATHTNSESAIMSHCSIFERLWIESEMKQS